MKQTLEIIERAYSIAGKPAMAYSGGTDSSVLLDIIYRKTAHRPALVYCDDQMSYPETEEFVRSQAAYYGAELIVARADRTPLQQWQRYGYAMLGKLAAVLWQRKHRDFGYKLNVTGCCRNMKTLPARRAIQGVGCDLQFTGQRGNSDDALRGLRAVKDGAVFWQQTDKLWIANPLTGWTDTMINRYVQQNGLAMHPAKARGAITIGCLFCGGGAQFDNSGFRILRHQLPDEWRKFVVDWEVGLIILSIKYDKPLQRVREAVDHFGGLTKLADQRPWLFDFLRINPLAGYNK